MAEATTVPGAVRTVRALIAQGRAVMQQGGVERLSGAAGLLGWIVTSALAGVVAPVLGGHGADWLLATRSVLLQVIAVVVLALPLGAFVGAVSALGPGLVRSALTRTVELTGALPSLVIVGLWRIGATSATALGFILIVSALKAVEVARLVSEQTETELRQEHVLAAHVLGARPGRVFRVHILPRLFPPLLIEAGSVAAYAVGLEAAAGFIGLGPSDVTTWGSLLGRAAQQGDVPAGLVWACLASLTAATLSLHALASRPAPQGPNRASQPADSD